MSRAPEPTRSPTVALDGSECLAVVATYNEFENLPRLVSELRDHFPCLSILVIDDGSPDGTGKWCDRFAVDHDWFDVIHRQGKQGLGSATIAGFRWAMEGRFQKVLTLDADFSHAPDQAPRLLVRSYQSDAPGIVIGSRYVPGGTIVGWPWRRRIASRAINRFARMWLGLNSHDNSGAFRCYDRQALQKIPLQRIRNQGYGYLEEILYLAKQEGISIAEVPITFRDRVAGESKISVSEALNALKTLGKLGFQSRFPSND